jgi:hypothetical protein
MKTQYAFALTCAVLLTGCGGGADHLKVVPIAGVVKYKGSPVADADIVFYPEKGPVGSAKSDAKGAFQIKTNGQSGGLAGKSKVTVSAPQNSAIPPSDGRAMEFANKSTVPSKYSSESTTDLSVDIASGGNRELQLELKD